MLKLYAVRAEDGRAAARALLARALEADYGLAALPELARAPGGKPYFPHYPDIQFNYSHSGPYALCALGSAPVGADIEVLRPRGAGLPQRALAPEELAWWSAQGGDWPAFFTLWTRKESWVKYTGTGLRAFRAEYPPLPGTAEGPLFLRTYADAGWVASVCAAAPLPEHILWL